MEAQEPPAANGAAADLTDPDGSSKAMVVAAEHSSASPAGGGLAKAATSAVKEETPARSLRKSSNRLAAAAAALSEKSPAANSPGKNGRRERKQKFDVKQLLNIRGSANNASPVSGTIPAGKNSRKSLVESASVNEESVKKTRRSGRVRASEAAAVGDSCNAAATNGDNGIVAKNSKEPLLRSTSPTLLVTGKRERKRKKFWDEQEPTVPSPTPPQTASSKVIKKSAVADKKPVTPSASSNSSVATNSSSSKSKGRKDKKVAVSATEEPPSSKSSKAASTSGSSVTETKRAPTLINKREKPLSSENGNGSAELAYLTFDLNDDPEVIAKQMIEGVNIPGPGVPIPVDSSSLPSGWEKRVIQREIGVTKGKWDVYIMSPHGKSFRSKIDLQKYFDEKKLQLSSDTFDFSLDNNLKRLRQIWKQWIIIPQRNKLAAEAAAKNNVEKTGNNGHDSQVDPVSTPSRVTTVPTNSSSAPPAVKSSRGSGTSDQAGSFGVESETGQGLRCSVDKCGKLFRNNRLLHMHIKHYHTKVFRETLQKSKREAANKLAAGISDSSTPKTDSTAVNDRISGLTSEETAEKSLDLPRKEAKKRRLISESKQASDPKKLRTSTSSTPTSSSHAAIDEDDISKAKQRMRNPSSRKSSVHIATDVEDDVFTPLNVLSSRTRNDSILSVGSEATTPGCTDEFAGPTPPTFRVSKRRQAQLSKRSSRVAKSNLSISVDEPHVEPDPCLESSSFDHVTGTSTPMAAASYPPSEMDASIVSEHLTNDEVVNCTCRRTEEDGLMIQCDICLCWQHGACLGIEEDHLVPEKHVCQICKDPPGGRANSRYSLDQDWLKEGKMTSIPLDDSSSSASVLGKNKYDENAFRKLSELMADLANLNKVLHALRVKLRVASQRNNTKVFMWSSPWLCRDAAVLSQGVAENSFQGQSQAQPELSETRSGSNSLSFEKEQQGLVSSARPEENTGSILPPTSTSSAFPSPSSMGKDASGEAGGSGKESTSTATSNGPIPVNGTASTHEEDSSNTSSMQSESDKKPPTNNGPVSEDLAKFESGGNSPNATVCMDMDGAVDHDLASGNVSTNEETVAMGDIDLSMIPSVSEVEQLLPSIIQASLEAQMGGATETNGDGGAAAAAALQSLAGGPSVSVPLSVPPQAQKPVFIPEQKRIDRDESRLNLLDHVERVQNDLDRIFDQVEAQLGVLEGGKNGCSENINQLSRNALALLTKTKAIAMTLAQDLSTSKKLMCALTK